MQDASTILRPHPSAAKPDFYVLLGPDYAGKSTLFRALSARTSVHLVSYDDGAGPGQPSFAGSFRKAFAAVSSTMANGAMSPEFILSLFHAYVVFVRDQIANAKASKPVVVDSYYYKILAKCVLAGIRNEDVFALWRALPQPSRVFYLDVDSEVAWQRCERGGLLNGFEYYGAYPTRPAFVRFQHDLRAVMLKEAATSTIEIIDQDGSLDDLVDDIEEVIGFARQASIPRLGPAPNPAPSCPAACHPAPIPAFQD
ncbi:hypothetical protein [Bradyrhizobium sp. CB1015]|uniref:dTMP kinase n=1 Tax=Bradyrhizobium sp. CB1015 TaxID=2976822 RepID=UPI0021A97F4D|nr:hypothetical protein [Bradyrhizobium sp. CB1015]UWU95728.1 hypothetical protein N2604_18380 [Bradyrhizobium sp. CB1015]